MRCWGKKNTGEKKLSSSQDSNCCLQAFMLKQQSRLMPTAPMPHLQDSMGLPADAVPPGPPSEGTMMRSDLQQTVSLGGPPEVAASNANFVKAISRQFNMEHLAPPAPAGSRKSLELKSPHAPSTQACSNRSLHGPLLA